MEQKARTQKSLNIKINAKKEALTQWQDKLVISDFEIENNQKKKYKLLKIKNLEIPQGDSTKGLATIVYQDNSKDKVFEDEQKVHFTFAKSENQTYRELQVTKDDFEIKTNILQKFNFLDISAQDFKVNRPYIKINHVKVFSWNLFDLKIALKLNVNVKEIQTSIFLEYPLEIDILKFVANLIEFNANNSFLVLNENLKFEPQKMEILTPDAHQYFNEKELVDLAKIVEEIKVFDIHIKHASEKINIFNSHNLGAFTGSIKVREKIFKNISFFANYDARILQEKIRKFLHDFSSIKVIKGKPHNLELSDILDDLDKVAQNDILVSRGFKNLILNQIEIVTKEIDVYKNQVSFEIFLNQSPIREVIFSKTLQFEISLIEELENNPKIIKIAAEHKLNNSPKLTEFIPEDFISSNSDFEVLKITPSPWEEKQLYLKSRKYQLEIIYQKQFPFSINKIINFAISHGEYEFDNLATENLNLEILNQQKIDYYQNLMNSESIKQIWIPISPELKKLVNVKLENEYLDLQVEAAEFKRIDFTNNKLLEFRIKVKAIKIQKEKFIYYNWEIDTSDVENLFAELNADKIMIRNRNVLASLPSYKLRLVDFSIEDPYRINNFDYKVNKVNHSMDVKFVATFLNAKKIITKNFYFGDLFSEVVNDDATNQFLDNLKIDDLKIDFDPENKTYHLDPKIEISLPNHPQIYIKLSKTILKNRRGKMKLHIDLKYGNNVKTLVKNIKFANKISSEEYVRYLRKNKSD